MPCSLPADYCGGRRGEERRGEERRGEESCCREEVQSTECFKGGNAMKLLKSETIVVQKRKVCLMDGILTEQRQETQCV